MADNPLIRLLTAVAYMVGGAWILDRLLRQLTDIQTSTALSTSEAMVNAVERISEVAIAAATRTAAAPDVPSARLPDATSQREQASMFAEAMDSPDYRGPYDPGLDPTDGIIPEQPGSPLSGMSGMGARVATVPAGAFGPNGDLIGTLRRGEFPGIPGGPPAPNLYSEEDI